MVTCPTIPSQSDILHNPPTFLYFKPIDVIYWVEIYYHLKTRHFVLHQEGEFLFFSPYFR